MVEEIGGIRRKKFITNSTDKAPPRFNIKQVIVKKPQQQYKKSIKIERESVKISEETTSNRPMLPHHHHSEDDLYLAFDRTTTEANANEEANIHHGLFYTSQTPTNSTPQHSEKSSAKP